MKLLKIMTLNAVMLSAECWGAEAAPIMHDIFVTGCTKGNLTKLTVSTGDLTVERLTPLITSAAMTLPGCREGGTIEIMQGGKYSKEAFTDEILRTYRSRIKNSATIIPVLYVNPE